MKLKNKLFILLLLFISLFLVLNTNVFAAEGDFESIENFQITDTLDWNTIKQKFSNNDISNFNSYDYHFITYNNVIEPQVYIYSTSSTPFINSTNSNICFSGYQYSYIYKINKETFSLNYSYTIGEEKSFSCGNISELRFSSVDIYDESGENLLFQGPPQVEPTILAPIVEGAGAQKTLQEILKILPKILVVLVSYLGLRKALKMLSALLHRS